MPKVIFLAVLCGFLFVDHARAQTPAKSGTRIITVGTAGGPAPRPGRAQSANLLVVNSTPYVIDAGDGTTRRLAKLKFDFRSLGTIFVTHGHNDHTGGLGSLLSAAWIARRTQPIHVYGPPKTEDLVKAAVQYYSFDSEIRTADGSHTVPIDRVFFGHDVKPGLVFEDKNVKVTATENSHFHFPAESAAFGKHRSYSYRFETSDRVVVFTGDTGPSDSVVTLAKNADVLVTEINSVDDAVESRKRRGQWNSLSATEQQETIRHLLEEALSPEEVGRLATKASVKAVILTHLRPRPSGDDYSEWAEQVRKHFSGQVTIAKDLMEF